jgi:uncharacterized protein YlaI
LTCKTALSNKEVDTSADPLEVEYIDNEEGDVIECGIQSNVSRRVYCSEKFRNDHDLDQHRNVNHPRHRYVCPVCKKRYTSRQIAREHLQMSHSIERFIAGEMVITLNLKPR